MGGLPAAAGGLSDSVLSPGGALEPRAFPVSTPLAAGATPTAPGGGGRGRGRGRGGGAGRGEDKHLGKEKQRERDSGI